MKKTIFNATHELEEFWQVLLAHQFYQCQYIIWCLVNFSWSASELWISDCVDFLQTPSRCPHGFAKIPRRSCGISSPLNASSLEKYRYNTQTINRSSTKTTNQLWRTSWYIKSISHGYHHIWQSAIWTSYNHIFEKRNWENRHFCQLVGSFNPFEKH